MRSLRRVVLAGLALLLSAWSVHAGPPIYHGVLGIRPAGGGIDSLSGKISLNVKNWTFRLDPGSDGLFPSNEPIVFALGDTEQWLLPAGALVPNRKGNRFTYVNPNKKLDRGIRLFRVVLAKDGSWRVKFKVVGVEVPRLTVQSPICEPLAVIIGDDDGFSGVRLTRPDGPNGKRVKLQAACDDLQEWPWL